MLSIFSHRSRNIYESLLCARGCHSLKPFEEQGLSLNTNTDTKLMYLHYKLVCSSEWNGTWCAVMKAVELWNLVEP